MNKKGLILIFLFVVSTVGFVALSNAATDSKVEVTVNYIPTNYIEMGYCWVEFDQRFIDDNTVVGQNDDIYFSFSYDVAIEAWGWGGSAGADVYGGGVQPNDWFYCDENNVTEGYEGNVKYNETRFAGMIDVILDGYDMGMSNFGLRDHLGTYQEIVLQLDIGWHYLTISAAELVSDANHTEWRWDYSTDEKRFYVGANKDVIPTPLELAYFNNVDVSKTAVLSEDLPLNGYEITGFLDNPRPIAEPNVTLQDQTQLVLGVEGSEVTNDIHAIYYASDTTDIDLVSSGAGAIYNDVNEMGPHTTTWRVNNQPAVMWNGSAYLDASGVSYNETSAAYENNIGLVSDSNILHGLVYGQNYVYFTVYGMAIDDLGLYYGFPVPRIVTDVAIFSLWIGPQPESTGLNFGILISVSILGLAAALYFVRRRK